jgi:hypothetical protein
VVVVVVVVVRERDRGSGKRTVGLCDHPTPECTKKKYPLNYCSKCLFGISKGLRVCSGLRGGFLLQCVVPQAVLLTPSDPSV